MTGRRRRALGLDVEGELLDGCEVGQLPAYRIPEVDTPWLVLFADLLEPDDEGQLVGDLDDLEARAASWRLLFG